MINVYRYDDDWGPYFQANVDDYVIKCRTHAGLMKALRCVAQPPTFNNVEDDGNRRCTGQPVSYRPADGQR